MVREAMADLFKPFSLGPIELANRFLFPPIKLGYGNPDGTVADRQLLFYQQISRRGPAVVILEPVSVTPEGREHPRQPCIHLPESARELKKIVAVIHKENRLACLHLNHAGAAANPMATKAKPKAPSPVTCATSGQTSDPLSEEDIKAIVAGYRAAARKALEAGFDLIEIQAGHGYLVSQFLNGKINKRGDAYGRDRLLFAQEVLAAVTEGASEQSFLMRISGNKMSPEYGVSPEDLVPFLKLAEDAGACAVHVGMGNACKTVRARERSLERVCEHLAWRGSAFPSRWGSGYGLRAVNLGRTQLRQEIRGFKHKEEREMFKLKPISKEAIPAAFEKAVHYRLRGEPAEAESICLDILEADPENQEALVTMLLAVTDQFDGRMAVTVPRAEEILSRIRDAYTRAYYAGVIWERQAKAHFKRGLPGSGDAAYSDFLKAMDYYEKAEKIRPPGNDSAILRWNTCARIIMREPEVAPKSETFREEMLE